MILTDPGIYFANNFEGEAGETAPSEKRPNGTPFIRVNMTVVASQGADEERVFLNTPLSRSITWYTSEAALPYALNRLKALGWNGDPDNPEFSVKETRVECVWEDDPRGGDRERWDLARSTRPMRKSARSALVDAWKKDGNAVTPGTAKPKLTPPKTEEATDDDMPF